MNVNSITQPMSLHGITALLKTIHASTRLDYKRFKEEAVKWTTILREIEEISSTLCVLLGHFKKSCQTPQLVTLTSSCIMDVLELVVFAIVDFYDDIKIYSHTIHILEDMDQLLADVLVCNTSPVFQEMSSRFSGRLKHLGWMMILHDDIFSPYSTIRSFLEYVDQTSIH